LGELLANGAHGHRINDRADPAQRRLTYTDAHTEPHPECDADYAHRFTIFDRGSKSYSGRPGDSAEPYSHASGASSCR
jgi:hypothetical protein